MYKKVTIFGAIVACTLTLAACTPATSTQEEDSSAMPRESVGDVVASPMSDRGEQGEVMYEKVVNYDNPSGSDDVSFKLTVVDGVISKVEVEPLAKHPTSLNRQNSFKGDIEGAVVGKPLAGLNVDRVGGSSLTTKAFNEWVATLN